MLEIFCCFYIPDDTLIGNFKLRRAVFFSTSFSSRTPPKTMKVLQHIIHSPLIIYSRRDAWFLGNLFTHYQNNNSAAVLPTLHLLLLYSCWHQRKELKISHCQLKPTK